MEGKTILAACFILIAGIFLFQGFNEEARFVDDYDSQWSERGSLDNTYQTDTGGLSVVDDDGIGSFFSDVQVKGAILEMDDAQITTTRDLDADDTVTVRTLNSNQSVIDSRTYQLQEGTASYDFEMLNETAESYEVDFQLSGRTDITEAKITGIRKGGEGFGEDVNEALFLLIAVLAILAIIKGL